MKTVFEILRDGLSEQGVEALLIGGYALQAYGVVRQTMDVDCVMADLDSAALAEILSRAGYSESVKTENFIRYVHTSIYLMDIDVVFVDRHTFDRMLQQSQSYCVGSVELRVPSLSHLVALKLHAMKNNPRREVRDLADIVELFRSNSDVLSADELETLCMKYGPDGIYSKMEAALR